MPLDNGPVDYRQIQSPAMLDTNLPDNGAASRAEALSSAFKDFSNVSSDIATKLAVQQGAAAGASAGLDPAFQPKTGLAAITASGNAYNAAAHVSFVNKQQASIEQQLSQAEQDNAGDPVAFGKVAAAIHDATVKQTPPLYQPEVSNMIQLRMQAGLTRTREQAIVTARSDAWESYTSTIDSRQRAALQTAATLPKDQADAVLANEVANNRQLLDGLVAARAITPEKSAILQRHFEESFQKQATGQHIASVVDNIMDLAKGGDMEAADRAMERFVLDPNVSHEDAAAVNEEYEKQREKFTKLQSQVHANDLASVGQSLVQDPNGVPGQGAFGPDIEARIHQLYKQGAINPEGLHSLMDQSMRNQVKSIQDNADNQLVDAAVNGTGPKLDPKDPNVAAAADTYFQAHIAVNGSKPGTDAYAMGAAAFVRQTNIVPASVQSQIRIGLMNGDANSAVAAAQLAERVRQANPQADLYAKDPKLEALSSLINDNIKAGLSPQQAYAMAVRHVDISPAEAKVREEAYKAAIKSQNANTPDAANTIALQKALDKATPGMFSSAPKAPIAMQAENDSLVRQFYMQTGDLPKAQALAAAQIQRTWGISTVNGERELMKYPISDADKPLVRADIAKTAKDIGYQGDPNNIKLSPSALTDQSGGRFWTLTHTDANGVTDTLLDHNNQPIQYDVRQTPQTYAARRQALIDQKLDLARKQRDAEREMAADQIRGEQELSNFYLTPQGRRQQRTDAR